MTPAFLRAVADTLLPGEASAPPGKTALPSASAAGVAIDAGAHRTVLEAIAARIGETKFAASPGPDRVAALKAVERGHPAAFRALVTALLSDYYSSDGALRALGWRAGAPQPRGHALPQFDADLLTKVRQRGRLWR